MSDIRINALATTAAASASDDYVAIDGSANGTRKLSAYSPTFGGNLTVSGGTATVGASGGGNGSLVLKRSSDGLTVGNLSVDTVNSLLNLDTAYSFATISTEGVERLRVGTITTTLAGNLTVSGTGTSTFAGNVAVTGTGTNYTAIDTGSFVKFGNNQTSSNLQVGAQGFGGVIQGAQSGSAAYNILAQPYGGNVLIGTTTDGGQKLQVNGSVNVFGGGTLAVTNAANTANIIRSSDSSGNAVDTVFKATGTTYAVRTTDTSGNLQTALTLDSSQRCILAGALRLNNAYVAGAPTATGYVTIQDSAGNTYKVLVGT